MCVRHKRAFALKSSLTTWMTLPTPAEPKLSFPGRARASAMSAARLSSFDPALTTMTKGVCAIIAEGTRSPATSQGSLSYSPGSRSEEHTSELQSRSDLVCRLLLEKKKKQTCHIRMQL